MSWTARILRPFIRRPAECVTPPPPVDVVSLSPGMAALKKTCVRLHPRLAGKRLPTGASKIGGTFLANDSAHWPTCAQHGAHFAVMQLRREDVPELPFPSGTTIFQLTWCGGDHEERYFPEIAVRWLRPEQAIASRAGNPAAPEPEDGSYALAECELLPERVVEFPNGHDVGDDLLEPIVTDEAVTALGMDLEPDYADEEAYGPDALGKTAYSSLLAAAPGTKVGGHPHWDDIAGWATCCDRRMEYVLTIAHEWDGHSMMRWLPHAELHDFPPQRYGQHGFPYTVHLFQCATCGAFDHLFRT